MKAVTFFPFFAVSLKKLFPSLFQRLIVSSVSGLALTQLAGTSRLGGTMARRCQQVQKFGCPGNLTTLAEWKSVFVLLI